MYNETRGLVNKAVRARRIEMKHLKTFVVIFSLMSLGGCQATAPSRQWSMQDKMDHFSNQSHHWGQKGQGTPNNGWSKYGFLQLEMGGPEYLQLSQCKGELLAKVVTVETDMEKFAGLSIPQAGIFYRPKDIGTCQPDPIEQVGVYAEMVLNYLAYAFPSGPEEKLPVGKIKANGPATEIRFMQAVARIDKPWSAEVEVKDSLPGSHIIEINQNGKIMIVHWSSKPQEKIDSSTPLNAWATCWSGVQSRSPDGKVSVKNSIENTDSISTFGDVRAQLKR
jgi:hypothetical protein